jgi:hypothetical protein
VKASVAPAVAKIIENLPAKDGTKRGVISNDVSYRITDKGFVAKRCLFEFKGGMGCECSRPR